MAYSLAALVAEVRRIIAAKYGVIMFDDLDPGLGDSIAALARKGKSPSEIAAALIESGRDNAAGT